MKRLLVVGLMMTCSVSWAEWEIAAATGKGKDDYDVYVDTSTIRRNGSIVKMWEMRDYASLRQNPAGKDFRSEKLLSAYDCQEETKAIFSIAQFENAMGTGSVVLSFTAGQSEWNWKPVVPGSSGKITWQIACGKK